MVFEFLGDLATIFWQPVYRSVCVAYTLYVAVMGVYAYWGPKAGKLARQRWDAAVGCSISCPWRARWPVCSWTQWRCGPFWA